MAKALSQIQKWFNKSYKGLKKQNFKQALKNGNCMYLAPDGNRCAVGQLLPKRTPGLAQIEGGVSLCRQRLCDAGLNITPETINFLEDLQFAHDYACDKKSMKRLLEDVAHRYGLSVPNA